MEFRGFLKDLQGWDSLHKDSSNKSNGRAQKAAKWMAGNVDEDKEPVSKFPASHVKKINEQVVSSREGSEHFGYLRNSGAFDLSSRFLNEGKLPDATSEKDLGNEYFKQKKFLEAIECYSRSIAFSPTSVAFANRAMAYLKVKKFVEAENDCTDALSLDDRYVKAYSRRITARKELGKLEKALEDADFAVRLEPNNPEVRNQYDEVKALLQMECVGNTSNNRPISLDNMAKGRFITESNKDSRSVNEQESLTSKLNTRIAKDSNGGNRKHEMKASVQDLASRAASQVLATSPKIFTIPTSAYQFEVSWRSLSDDSAKQVQLLKAIPPSDLPKIFKNALTAHILVDIVRCIATFFRDDTSFAVSMINNLTNVPRFDLIIMCLSAVDRAVIDKLWEEVFSSNQIQQDLRQALVKLRPKYCFRELESHILSS
ncbi:RNA polymerase II-associated protein 3 [Phalaenopsis equestris]|uniref:RNA polymerase II-associated protein 3 n=2 Tax=Phalaenopsis equestris TaxID=78828 RepID=UPI0009E4AB6F|nr:RNA polymerase II-associated protein 3 [Phalaenopsis equestris]